MAKQKDISALQIRTRLINISIIHFFLLGAYGLSVIAYDAWKLITAEALKQRWALIIIVLLVVTVVWLAAHQRAKAEAFYKMLLVVLIIMDTVFVASNVYFQRGMSSRAVVLFAIPIVISALLQSKRALLATATLATAAYSWAAIRYFADHPSEGYKIELYGEVGLYSASFFILALLLWQIVRPKIDS